MHILSKSTFIRGDQCIKALYLNHYNKELQKKSSSLEATFEQGINVGILAQNLFPNGIRVSLDKYDTAVFETRQLINVGNSIIYEAAFLFDDVFSSLDILVRKDNAWLGFEVKSSTEVKENHILDAALQYYIIRQSGIDLKDIFIVYIDKRYVRQEALEVEKMFTKKSVLKEVLKLQSTIPIKIQQFKAVLEQENAPTIDIGLHCSKPYPCDFIDYCWKKIPQYSVFDISNLSTKKKFELYKQGFIGFKDIPKNTNLNSKQWQQINSELEQKEIIEKGKIEKFINSFTYPLYFLDFETFQLAIPLFKNTRPYQLLPFQYSLHNININGDLSHAEFIAEVNDIDTRIQFIKKLIIDCGEKGSVLVYNAAFEKTRLQELANDFPEYSVAIQSLITRLVDLMIPFKERWYYTPLMKGSYSIKVVLPALISEFSYNNLEIKSGDVASLIYSSMIQGTFVGDKTKTIEALLAYCKLDTLAMVKIFEKLRSII